MVDNIMNTKDSNSNR